MGWRTLWMSVSESNVYLPMGWPIGLQAINDSDTVSLPLDFVQLADPLLWKGVSTCLLIEPLGLTSVNESDTESQFIFKL